MNDMKILSGLKANLKEKNIDESWKIQPSSNILPLKSPR